jgi:hypothetical protein
MSRALRRAWWALAAVVGLGVGIPAVRLSAAKPFEHQAAPAGTTPNMEAASVEAPADRRLVEIEVELAWLADPVTFPYHLGAQLRAGTLHVTGYVQTTTEREHALQVARSRCPLEVIDELKTHPGIMLRQVNVEPLQARVDAENALLEDFPKDASRFKVTCGPDGLLMVGGTIGSPLEKLAVSRRLRHLPNCTAVVNRLQVVTAGVSPSSTAAAPSAGKAPENSRAPAVATLVNKPGVPWVPVANWEPVVGVPAPAAGPASPNAQAGPNTSWRSLSPTSYQAPPTSAPAEAFEFHKAGPTGPPSAVPMVPLPARVKKQIEDVCGGAAKVNVVARSATDLLVQLKVRSEAEADRLTGKILTMPELGPYHVELDVKMTETPAAPAPSSAAPPVRTTVPSSVPHTAAPAGSFAGNVVPPLQGVPYAVPPAAATPPIPVPARLKEQIEHACGTGAIDVCVLACSATKVLVQFRARSEVEGERLAQKVLAMPELALYHVDLDVKVAETPAAPAAPVARVSPTPAASDWKRPARPDPLPALPSVPAPKLAAAPPAVPPLPPVVTPAPVASRKEPARPDLLPALPEIPAPKFAAAPPPVPAPPVPAPPVVVAPPPVISTPPAVATAVKKEETIAVQRAAPPAPAPAAGEVYVTTGVAVISEPASEAGPSAPLLPVRPIQRVEPVHVSGTPATSAEGAVRADRMPGALPPPSGAVASPYASPLSPPASQRVEAVSSAGSPYASSGVVVRTDVAPGATASSLSGPALVKAPMDSGSSRRVPFPAAFPVPAAAPSALLAAAHLKERIETVCGSRAMDVRVIAQSATDLTVQLNVRNAADAAQLTTKLTIMPELASYHVKLQLKTLQ